MATVGSVQGEKCVEESDECTDCVWSSLTGRCRRNGLNNGCQCAENSCSTGNGELTKYSCVVKINGLKALTKQTTAARSLQLRPRAYRSPRLASHHPRSDAKGCQLRENHSQTNRCSLNNNNEDSSSMVSSMAGSSEDVRDKAEDCSKAQLCKNGKQQPLQRCDSWDLRHSGSKHSCQVFHCVKDIEVTSLNNKAVNGHRHKVKNGHVHVSPPVSSCCIDLLCPPLESCQSSSAASSVVSSTHPQLTKAAKISPSSIVPSEDSLSAPEQKNGNQSCAHAAPGSLPSWASSSSLSSESSRQCHQGVVSNGSSSAASQVGGDDQKNRSLCSALFLLNQENSSSSISSLVSFSSQDDSLATVTDDKSTKLRTCNWQNCGKELEPTELMDHIQSCHVQCQNGESFVCLWNGCKVYNKSSSSRRWLERHILSHSGDKPFRCIVDKCGMQFTSQYGLERHVNSHFNNVSRPTGSKPARHKEDTPSKLSKKKKVKRKRALPVKSDDFFDQRIMEGIQYHLLQLSSATLMDLSVSGNKVTFHSTVIARRRDPSGLVQVLLRWTPENILSDSWVPESQVEKMSTQVKHLAELPHDTIINLDSSFYVQHRYRKHRRK